MVAGGGCGGSVEPGAADGADGDSELGSVASPLGSAANGYGCDPAANAGAGWSNTFFPQSTQSFEVQFRAWPRGTDASGHPLLDAVAGLSDGPAGAFASLGPIVRFNASGNIDARNGDVYAGGFPYRTFEPYEFQLSVDVPSHTYSVWVRHLDAIGKPFELLADRFAFRSQQNSVTRLDNIGRFVDSSSGELETCGFRYTGPSACSVSRPGEWRSQAFPAKTGRFKLELDATPAAGASGAIDAVIGTASGAPHAFSALAAIVRFRPDGTLDARNGSVYAADTVFSYADATSYHITLDIDAARGRYSVYVKDSTRPPDAPATSLAHDYAFRSEQAATTSFDHVAQLVDADAGTLDVCSLTVVY
jgi:hypothetical protein